MMLKSFNSCPALAPVASRRVVPFAPCRQGPSCKGRTQHLHSVNHASAVSDASRDQESHGLTNRADHASHTCQTSRRAAVLALVSGTFALGPRPSSADEETKLPKEYRQLVKRLSEGLSESIEAEASGASEAEVRRKADPAKDTVREFVRKWRDNPRVSSDITHAELKEALAELGEFYLAYGQRTKLTPPVRESVLRHLSAARAALPGEPEKKGSGLLDLF